MLQKYSYRKVAITGACIYFIGNFAAIFVQNLPQLVLSFGVLQGEINQKSTTNKLIKHYLI